MALERTDGSSLLVRMMTRVEGEALRSRACTSSPFMAGIKMSITANARAMNCGVLQKGDGSVESFHLPSGRIEKAAGGLQDRRIIVYDAYD